jgi:DNA-binding transcriptional regulator YiaG
MTTTTKNYIRKLRNKLMLNQQEFADAMAVTSDTVSRWEREFQRPKPVHLRRMARIAKKNGIEFDVT